MKHLKKLALSMLLLTSSGWAANEVALDVMTFNIRFGIAYDRENNWPNRQDMVVNMLKKYDADIIGTQELLPFQADYITAQIPEYRWFGASRNDGALPERSAILYKWREVVPIETGTFWLSETPDVFGSSSWNSSVARIATWGRFHHLASGENFFVYNTHFDHVSQEARLNGMQVIIDHVEQHAGDVPVIFTGDFNVTATKNEVYDKAIEAGFADAWLVAAERVGPETTWNAFQPLNEGSDRRIDWIMTKGRIAVDHCETIIYTENDRWPSDHFPVMAKLRINPVAE